MKLQKKDSGANEYIQGVADGLSTESELLGQLVGHLRCARSGRTGLRIPSCSRRYTSQLWNWAVSFRRNLSPLWAAIEKLLRQTKDELRSLPHALRPSVLDNLGLVPAVETLADRIKKRAGLAVTVSSDLRARLPSAVETTLVRI